MDVRALKVLAARHCLQLPTFFKLAITLQAHTCRLSIMNLHVLVIKSVAANAKAHDVRRHRVYL